ncbi:MAG: prepilin-type N-terminal cleavage/methylation domain-containing protein [Oscillatoriales cyanobacterium C42_A2020_001]|nr:prepilin-type N-terminal cleavage/methylation domain-containing protein [Leptolyngbyaceae cyanobacterium C42_A2020_001]
MKRSNSPSSSGFTLLEMIAVLLIIGVLCAIAAPSWLHLIDTSRLNNAQDEVLQALKTAQHRARLNKVTWEFGIRELTDGSVQWAIYSESTDSSSAAWNNLDPVIKLDSETTLRNVNGVHRIQFNHLGAVNGQLGRVTLSSKNSNNIKRCVIVSTLLGALRKGYNQTRPSNGRVCY